MLRNTNAEPKKRIDKRAWEFATLMLADRIDEKGGVWNITTNVKLFDSLEGEKKSDKSKG
jgi:hypothetical protein